MQTEKMKKYMLMFPNELPISHVSFRHIDTVNYAVAVKDAMFPEVSREIRVTYWDDDNERTKTIPVDLQKDPATVILEANVDLKILEITDEKPEKVRISKIVRKGEKVILNTRGSAYLLCVLKDDWRVKRFDSILVLTSEQLVVFDHV